MQVGVVKVADLLKSKGHSVRTIKPSDTIEALSHQLQQFFVIRKRRDEHLIGYFPNEYGLS